MNEVTSIDGQSVKRYGRGDDECDSAYSLSSRYERGQRHASRIYTQESNEQCDVVDLCDDEEDSRDENEEYENDSFCDARD